MRVLVTNDDGVDAPGIAALAAAVVERGHDVVVVAPTSGYSGASAAIGDLAPGVPIGHRRAAIGGLDIPVHGVDGPPSLCVILANLGVFGPSPEIVVSGVNAGLNTGPSILHSGTIGAALTSVNRAEASGIASGVAVSIEGLEPAHFDTAASLAAATIDHVATLPVGTVVNLNVPDRPAAEVLGVRPAVPAATGEWTVKIGEVTEDKIELGLTLASAPVDPGSDTGLVRAGWATVTVLTGPRPVSADGAATIASRLGG